MGPTPGRPCTATTGGSTPTTSSRASSSCRCRARWRTSAKARSWPCPARSTTRSTTAPTSAGACSMCTRRTGASPTSCAGWPTEAPAVRRRLRAGPIAPRLLEALAVAQRAADGERVLGPRAVAQVRLRDPTPRGALDKLQPVAVEDQPRSLDVRLAGVDADPEDALADAACRGQDADGDCRSRAGWASRGGRCGVRVARDRAGRRSRRAAVPAAHVGRAGVGVVSNAVAVEVTDRRHAAAGRRRLGDLLRPALPPVVATDAEPAAGTDRDRRVWRDDGPRIDGQHADGCSTRPAATATTRSARAAVATGARRELAFVDVDAGWAAVAPRTAGLAQAAVAALAAVGGVDDRAIQDQDVGPRAGEHADRAAATLAAGAAGARTSARAAAGSGNADVV